MREKRSFLVTERCSDRSAGLRAVLAAGFGLHAAYGDDVRSVLGDACAGGDHGDGGAAGSAQDFGADHAWRRRGVRRADVGRDAGEQGREVRHVGGVCRVCLFQSADADGGASATARADPHGEQRG